jgi:hypothetical protein
MPTPAQRSAAYRAQQRTLLGDIAYKAQQSAQRQARRMHVRILNNPQLIPQVPALPVNILQPPPIPQILPIDIDDIGPPLPTNNPFSPPIIPPRPNSMKLKQFLQSQNQPTIPPRPKKQPPPTPPPTPQKINNPMMNSDDYLNRMNNMFETPPPTPQKPIQQQTPIKEPPTPQKPIQQQTPIKEPPTFKSRLNILLKQHNIEREPSLLPSHPQYLPIPDEYNKHPAKNNIRDDVKETTLKQYNNKVLNFYNKFYKEQLGEIPNNKTPVSKNYNEWLYDKKLYIDIKKAYDKPDTQRALTTAILSLVERDKLYENENKLKNHLRTLQTYFQKQANEKKN